MSSRWGILRPTVILFLLTALALAANFKLSGAQRQEIIRAFLAERAYAHRAIPLGKTGMVIDGASVSPSETDGMQRGTAARAGERVEITGVRLVREGILFEINGGAVKREKWSERIQVGMGGPDLRSSRPADPNVPAGNAPAGKDALDGRDPEPKGASILLKLDNGSGITAERVRALLAPVLDFGSISQAEAYQKNLSPVLAAAVREHRALVGMDRDMVFAAMGRPTRRLRESGEGQEYEEWIYGSPPQEVHFIRFVRGKVVRIEQMKVTGEKLVRTENEVGKVEGMLDASVPAAGAPPAMAAPAEQTPGVGAPGATPPSATPEAQRRKPPTLLRPGEAPLPSK